MKMQALLLQYFPRLPELTFVKLRRQLFLASIFEGRYLVFTSTTSEHSFITYSVSKSANTNLFFFRKLAARYFGLKIYDGYIFVAVATMSIECDAKGADVGIAVVYARMWITLHDLIEAQPGRSDAPAASFVVSDGIKAVAAFLHRARTASIPRRSVEHQVPTPKQLLSTPDEGGETAGRSLVTHRQHSLTLNPSIQTAVAFGLNPCNGTSSDLPPLYVATSDADDERFDPTYRTDNCLVSLTPTRKGRVGAGDTVKLPESEPWIERPDMMMPVLPET